MAVLDAYPGLTTVITVNREPLAEYNDDDGEKSMTEVTKYIEACSGAEFVIKTTFEEPFPINHGVEISVSVDGNRGHRAGAEPSKLYVSASKRRDMTFTESGKRYHQNYQFAELNIGKHLLHICDVSLLSMGTVEEVEGQLDIKSLRKEMESKGCIEVSYRWITNLQPVETRIDIETIAKQEPQDPNAPMPRRQLPIVSAVPEKALKGDARSHQIVLGEPTAKDPKITRKVYDYVDSDPFGIFRFRYRSLAAIKALRIIVDDEPEQAMIGSRRRQPSRTPLHDRTEHQGVKQEAGARSRIKCEHAQEDSDDLTVVGSRSCKRPRPDHEVIVLD